MENKEILLSSQIHHRKCLRFRLLLLRYGTSSQQQLELTRIWTKTTYWLVWTIQYMNNNNNTSNMQINYIYHSHHHHHHLINIYPRTAIEFIHSTHGRFDLFTIYRLLISEGMREVADRYLQNSHKQQRYQVSFVPQCRHLWIRRVVVVVLLLRFFLWWCTW